MISNAQIDFEACKNLPAKYVLKLFFSLYWRQILFQFFPTLVIVILAAIHNRGESISIIAICLLYLSAILLTNKYIINSLSRIKYKDFSIFLARDNQILEEMTFYDCLCWLGSLVWRQLIFALAYAAFIFSLEYFQLSPELSSKYIDWGTNIGILLVGFGWILKTKKTGRLVLIQPKIF